MDTYCVEVIWRYAQGHRETSVRQVRVKSTSEEAAEEWAKESLRRKFYPEEVEVVKATAMWEG